MPDLQIVSSPHHQPLLYHPVGALAHMSCDPDQGFFGGGLDVKNFPYNLALPVELRPYFH